MAQTIKLRRSSTAGAVPTTAQLALGEVAINTADGKLFIKKNDGTESIVEIGATGATVASSPVKFDDISGSFNGSNTTFNITVSSSAYTPGDALTTIVSINGVTQEPNTAYTISGSQITFTDPPASTDDFYGIDLSTIISQTFSAGTEASPGITFSGDTDTGIYKPAADTLGFSTNGDEKLRVDSDGRLLVGGTTNVTHFIPPFSTLSPRVQVSGTTHSGSSFSVTNYSSSGHPGHLLLGSSKGGTVGTQGIVADDGDLGRISFTGSDGTNLISAASILAEVDGTPGTNDMPGRLVFQTTPDGSTTLTERMRIDSSGNVGIGTISPQTLLTLRGSTPRLTFEPTADTQNCRIQFANTSGTLQSVIASGGANGATMQFSDLVASTERMRISSNGNIGIGTTNPLTKLHIAGATNNILRVDSGATAISLHDGGTNNYAFIGHDSGKLFINAGGTADFLALRTGGLDALAINASRDVGIGTNSPDEKLHISAGANSAIRLGQAGGDYAYRLRANVSSSVNGGFLIEDAVSGNDLYKVVSGATGSHKFSVNGTERVRIGADGQIGIGGANYGTAGQALLSQGPSAAPQWGSVGLTGFTSSENTSSPNNTDNVSAISVDSTSTDGFFALVPKGTGGILAAIPDGTFNGGNTRGDYSVDLQLNRSSAAYVASGTYSGLFAGNGNAASNVVSVCIGGEFNDVSSRYAGIFAGRTNDIVGNSDYAVIVGGDGHVLSAANNGAMVGGSRNDLDGDNSVILGGIYSTDYGNEDCLVFPSGNAHNNPVDGNSQSRRMIVGVETSDATETTLTSDVNVPANSRGTRLICGDSTVNYITVRTMATTQDAAVVAVWETDLVVSVSSTGTGTIEYESTTQKFADSGASSWSIDFAFASGFNNPSSGVGAFLDVNVTGAASTDIRWIAQLDSTECKTNSIP